MPLADDRFNWLYQSEPEPELADRTIVEARGRVLGGSSSINGMNWVRGNPWDYDNWASLGLSGWSYAECLPYFRRAETFAGGADRYRGGSGPMRIERCRAEGPLYHAFIEAGTQAGHAHVADHNAFRQEGVHVTQRNVHEAFAGAPRKPTCMRQRRVPIWTLQPAPASPGWYSGHSDRSGKAPPG